MNAIIQDLRYALRQVRKSPGFTVVAVLTLALGIGANTAIFSIVNALLVKSLPYSHPERMGTIYTRVRGPQSWDERDNLNGEQWELLRDNVPALISAISSFGPSGVSLQFGSRVQYVQAGRISAHYFDVLAFHPLIGRNFSEDEDRPHGPKTAILSHKLWRNTFNSNPDIVGQSVLLKGEPYTLIGVLPEDANIPAEADLYTPLQASREGEGKGTNFDCITRLREGATWREADAQINRAWLQRANRYELNDSPGADVSYHSIPLQKGESDPLRPQVLTLMLSVGFILLIACANLAGLTLVRVLRRNSEIATRMALGASPWQIQKQLWTENLLLALIGGGAGVFVGSTALRGLLLLLPEHFLPVADVSLDGRVLGFTLLLSILTSVLFGMLPALTMRRFELRAAMATRDFARRDRLGLRQSLITVEVALTVVLLAGSGLLIRTLIHLQNLPPGFNPSGVMTGRASLDNVRYHDAGNFRKLLTESIDAMRQIPGVQEAAVGLSLPYERAVTNGLTIGDGKQAGQLVMTGSVYVTPEYFSTLQIPLLAGRSFTDGDGPDSQRVAIVNQMFVRKFFQGENPIGRHLNKNTVIIGVVSDVAMKPAIDAVAPLSGEQTMYKPASQMQAAELSLIHMWFQPNWIVRTSRPIEELTAQMQRALSSVDPGLPFSGFYRMQDLLAKTLAIQRAEVGLLGVVAGLALLLSAMGVFALVANIVAHRIREIGIRMALGSPVHAAMVHVGIPGLRASAMGLAIGLILCMAVLRVMKSVLYGISAYDAPTIVAVGAIIGFVALIAATMPALRIAKIDPAKTLRDE
jgi:predicted permease